MRTRPDELWDHDVVAGLHNGWGIRSAEVAYAPVGFGSHHWTVATDGRRWFATVDDLEARRRHSGETRGDASERLAAALGTARSLRDAGLDFVVAPQPGELGELLWPIDDRFVLAVYPWVDGDPHEYGHYPAASERSAVVDLLADVHGCGAPVPAVVDDLLIPSRAELETSLGSHGSTWGPGPFAEPAQRVVDQHAGVLANLLVRYDELAASGGPLVVTHGEPHRGNTITTDAGTVLIDWDTALLAPPERDLWSLFDEDPAIADRYSEATGRTVEPNAIALYRLWWVLCEISLFTADFRAPHHDTADRRLAWQGLVHHLDPARLTDLQRKVSDTRRCKCAE